MRRGDARSVCAACLGRARRHGGERVLLGGLSGAISAWAARGLEPPASGGCSRCSTRRGLCPALGLLAGRDFSRVALSSIERRLEALASTWVCVYSCTGAVSSPSSSCVDEGARVMSRWWECVLFGGSSGAACERELLELESAERLHCRISLHAPCGGNRRLVNEELLLLNARALERAACAEAPRGVPRAYDGRGVVRFARWLDGSSGGRDVASMARGAGDACEWVLPEVLGKLNDAGSLGLAS
ncbi:hypothetical protein FB451DRAFT_1406025 [Mycena latifolia]|nr:hypothetical protein FB451DRAFT_1406025 [Mycena latifolia]